MKKMVGMLLFVLSAIGYCDNANAQAVRRTTTVRTGVAGPVVTTHRTTVAAPAVRPVVAPVRRAVTPGRPVVAPVRRAVR
jgi:hypothetical protein